MTTDTPLLPCPFCGGQPIFIASEYHFARCRSCGAEGPWKAERSSAVDGWNMRQPNDAVAVLRELVTLHDKTPDDYDTRKPLAWQAARNVLRERE
jgi:Lar family restriction alleviation protein